MKVYLAFSDLCIKKSCFFKKLQWPLTLEASLIIGRNVAAKFALTACKQGGHKGGPTGGPGPSDFRNNEKKCIFKKKPAIKFCAICSWRRLGTCAPHLTLSLYLYYSVFPEITQEGEAIALEGRRVACQLKKAFKGLRHRRGSCWENKKRTVLCTRGHWFALQGNSMIFLWHEPKVEIRPSYRYEVVLVIFIRIRIVQTPVRSYKLARERFIMLKENSLSVPPNIWLSASPLL